MATTGKNNNGAFLNLFWDLASDERDKRLSAAQQIIAHIKASEEQGTKVDMEYTLKRLVRGLGSSRDSARQGFVTCLCELLEVVKAIDIPSTLELIDEHTKVIDALCCLHWPTAGIRRCRYYSARYRAGYALFLESISLTPPLPPSHRPYPHPHPDYWLVERFRRARFHLR
jgi:hypothetical protein